MKKAEEVNKRHDELLEELNKKWNELEGRITAAATTTNAL